MKHTFSVLAVSALLTGCLSDDEDARVAACYTPTSTEEPRTGATGLTLLPSSGMFVTFEQVETAYLDVEQCMGISADGPRVAFQSFEQLSLGNGHGVYSMGDKSVRVNTDPIPHVSQDCEIQTQVLKHEFVHHILNEAGAVADSLAHNSPYFAQCAPIVVAN